MTTGEAGEGPSHLLLGLPEDAETHPITVFVTDPSAEAERVAQLLRGAGVLVVDVPLAMLAARVAVQTPTVVLIDADDAGAADATMAVRGSPGAEGVAILFLGEKRLSDASPMADVLSDGAHGFFARPVDASALVARIQRIARSAGPTTSNRPVANPRSTPPSPSSPPSARGRSANPPPDVRSSPPSSPVSSPAPVSARPPSSGSAGASSGPLSARSARPAVSIQSVLSSELEALLLEAEQRMGTQGTLEVAPPTPEEELDAVLPEALLAALDEPIDDDEDEMPGDVALSIGIATGRPPVDNARHETSAGRPLTPPPSLVGTGESGTGPGLGGAIGSEVAFDAFGVAPTMAAPAPPEPDPPIVVPVARAPFASHESVLTRDEPSPSTLLEREEIPRHLAKAIVARASGCITYESDGRVRRVVLRDGDVVTAASSAEDEALLVFLTARGDFRAGDVREFASRIPPFGRHAGAALVAHGLLLQDQLWPTLRAHAEWLIGRVLLAERATSWVEAEPEGRLRQEPSVFGGSSGAEVLVEAIRRVVPPEEAIRRLGGAGAVVADGPTSLLVECALDAGDRASIEGARGNSLAELMTSATDARTPELATVIYALTLLSIVVVAPPAPAYGAYSLAPAASPATGGAIDLDRVALRERVLARRDLVRDGDYFTLLGVSRDATGYDVRRAYLELRRAFEPTRILTPELADLESDVRTIVGVLDEAYEILRDGVRRERYRRALGE